MKVFTCSTIAWIAIGFILLLALALFPQDASAAQRCDFQVQLSSESKTPASLAPGEIFHKSFKLVDKNACGWPSGLQLVFVDGDHMSGPKERDLRSPKAGESLEVNFDLQAPTGAGEYQGVWQLAAEGRTFGPRLVVKVLVVTPTATPTQALANPGSEPTATPPDLANPGSGDGEGPGGGLPEGVPGPETVLEMAEDWTTVPAGGIAFSSVQCSEGVVTGGGWTLVGASYDPRVYRSRMANNGWIVSARNESDTDVTLKAYAVCLKNTQGTIFEMTQLVDVPQNDFTYDTIQCPANSVRTGGGFDVYAYNGMDIQVSSADSETSGWLMRVINHHFIPESAMNTIVCLQGVISTTSVEKSDDFQVGYMLDQVFPGHGVVACPAGKLASSGGFGYSDFIYFESILMANNTWSVLAMNPKVTPANETPPYMYASVNCLSFP